jgi:SAM-dependent methyltransferase
MEILDLGCGKKKYPDSLGLDISDQTDADIIHDMNVFPYPFEDNRFDMIYADNILEHLDNVVRVMEEIHRITKNGAKIKIVVPYFRSLYAFIDPTHKHFFTTMSFYYFDPDQIYSRLYKYSNARFKIKKVVFDEGLTHNLPGKMVAWLANKKPEFYEYFFSHLFPLKALTYYLETVKQ